MNGALRPVVLFDLEPPLLTALDDIVGRQPERHPLMLVNRQPQVRAYVWDAANAGRLPVLLVVRIRAATTDDHGLQLTQWLGAQPEPVGSVPILAIGHLPFVLAIPPFAIVDPGDAVSLEAAVRQALALVSGASSV